MKLTSVIKTIIDRTGGERDKFVLHDFLQSINHSLVFASPNYWMGVPITKSPLDLMVLQEILFEKRPNTIIECGTGHGGSAYYMACLMDLMKIDGKIITVDHVSYELMGYPIKNFVNRDGKVVAIHGYLHEMPNHPKIEFVRSDCLKALIPVREGRTMVILDCHHSAKHVYRELERYSSMVSVGQYLIVEDTDAPKRERGPAAAVEKFLKNNKNFIIDKSREKYGISSNLGGYLLRMQ